MSEDDRNNGKGKGNKKEEAKIVDAEKAFKMKYLQDQLSGRIEKIEKKPAKIRQLDRKDRKR